MVSVAGLREKNRLGLRHKTPPGCARTLRCTALPAGLPAAKTKPNFLKFPNDQQQQRQQREKGEGEGDGYQRCTRHFGQQCLRNMAQFKCVLGEEMALQEIVE